MAVLWSHLPLENGRHFADMFKWIKMNDFFNLIQTSLTFAPMDAIDNSPALVQVMAWRRTGGKPLSGLILTKFTDAYMRH